MNRDLHSTAAAFRSGERRSVMSAMRRGLLGYCPNCGKGRLFARFVTTNRKCSSCGTEIHHHRADDLPAYLVVLIVGHVMVGFAMFLQAATELTIWQQLAFLAPITILVSILALRPLKGAVVGLQWALYMHGFGGEDDGDNTE